MQKPMRPMISTKSAPSASTWNHGSSAQISPPAVKTGRATSTEPASTTTAETRWQSSKTTREAVLGIMAMITDRASGHATSARSIEEVSIA